MTKKNLGRPSKINPETIKKLEEAFAMDCTVREACLYAGITYQTMYNRQAKDKALFERLELMRETPVYLARKSVIHNMQKDWDLALKYLERKCKDEFSPKKEVEHSGEISQTIIKIWQQKP